MKLVKPALVLAVLGASIAPAGASAPSVTAGGAQFTLGIAGNVPVICRANVDATRIAPAAGRTSLGMLNEFCNSPTGYRVIADYSANLANARLIVDGTAVTLGSSGSAVISQSAGAAIANHALALDLPKGGAAGSISFRIEPR